MEVKHFASKYYNDIKLSMEASRNGRPKRADNILSCVKFMYGYIYVYTAMEFWAKVIPKFTSTLNSAQIPGQ